MYIFKLKPTTKSRQWFIDNGYDLKAMAAALSLLFAEVEPGSITRIINLTIQVVEGADESAYMFTTNKIWLCDEPDIGAKSSKRRTLAIFEHFLHEFRHWMQSRIYKISGKELTYNQDDVDRNSNAYYRNEHEVDARRFSKQQLSKFYKYYKNFRH
jgi:hypothetical protein